MASEPKIIAPMTDAEQKKVTTPEQAWSDSFLAKVITADFDEAARYREAAHDWRWRIHDEIYQAWCEQLYWPQSKQPRSSLSIYLAFEQIETLLPKVLAEIWGEVPPFQVDPRPGTKFAEAQATSDLMEWQLEETRAWVVFYHALKSAAIYGDGIVELAWDAREVTRRHWVASWQPVMKKIQSILGLVEVPVGRKRVVRELVSKEMVNMPTLDAISIKQMYFDPNCQSPDPQKGRFAIKRTFLTIDEILSYDGMKGFNIPPKERLLSLAERKPTTNTDNALSSSEQARGVRWEPSKDYTADPSGKRIEVLQWDGGPNYSRRGWLLGREDVMYNGPGFGFCPYFHFFYSDVPDRFYSLGVCDVLEGDQRLIQGIVNARIDELSLNINASTIKRRGATVAQSQYRRRPGNVIEVENPKEDIIREETQNITAQAYIEVDAAERRSQKITGVTDLAALGTPAAGGNAASRTATGVSVQAQATATRLQFMVAKAEAFAIEPLLVAMHTLNVRWLDPNQVVEVLGRDGRQVQIDPLAVKNARVKFSMRAAQRMQSRIGLLQLFPLVAQTFLNPDFLNMLARTQGMTVDVLEMGKALEDVSGYRRRYGGFFRPLSQQERQMMMQPPPEELIRMQMQRERLAGQSEVAGEKNATQILSTLAGKIAEAELAPSEPEEPGSAAEPE